MNEIAAKEKPDIITLNDTNLKGKFKVKVPGYFSYNKNREKYKGGVSTIVSNHIKHNTMKVSEGKEGDEYIITRFYHTVPVINLVNIYGQQEGKTDNDEIEKSWHRLMNDVKEIEERKEAILIIGDVNRAIGNDEFGVEGNKPKISYGGHLIRSMIKDRLYIVINNLDIVIGGPWTFVDRQDNNRKSCLDIGIMSVSLIPYLTSVVVDVERKFTPRRTIKTKKKTTSIFTDHYSLKVEFEDIPRKIDNDKPEPSWNLGKPEGWNNFESITNDAAEKIEETVEDIAMDINDVMKKIEKIDTKIKFKAFGKTKPNVKCVKNVLKLNKCQKTCENTSCDNCKNQAQRDEDLHDKQTQRIESAVNKVMQSSHGRAGNIYKMKKDIVGPKKTPQEAAAIRDPKTGEMIVDKEKIKEITLKYCVDNLTNNKPDEEVKEKVMKRKEDQLKKMEDTTGETFVVTIEDFNQVLAKFAMKETKTYDFLIKAGDKYKFAMFKICKRIIENEEIPDSFKRTILHMIWKRKGSMDILKHNRFLHIKEVLARTVDAMVVKQMKYPLISKLSMYQIGGLPGHSILEHLLTLKTVMARIEELKECVIFLIMDIISFFDKEDIYDCLETMEELEINKKAVRMWYLLNRNTRISVKTAFGMTMEAEVGDCLGQGTSGAGLVSAANLDIGLQKCFNTSKEVMHYGKVRIQPLSYQDDVGSICTSVEMARSQACEMTKMLQLKTLDAHPDKSGIVILGSKHGRKKVEKELENNPIDFKKFKLKIKEDDKYLGQILKSDLATSALATVEDRAGKVKGAAIEVKSIIEDYKMQAMGGLVAAWVLWERALVPSILAGAGTWLGNIKEAIKLCNSLQDFYWRVVLKVPESCPKLALQCETKMTDMKWRVYEEKCLLLLRIKLLEDGSLAKTINEEAEDQGWPGLWKEVRSICIEIGIPDINLYQVRKQDVKKAIFKAHYQEMMIQFDTSKKLQDIKHDNFHELQDYFNDKSLENARMKFKIRSKMLQNIPGNFKNKYKFKENGLKCNLCPNEMTQNHCKICPERSEARNNLDMDNLDDLVIYFKNILN